MDFSWSSEQEDVYSRAVAFAKARLGELRPSPDRFPRDAWRECSEFGLFTMPVSASRGGMGSDPLLVARVMEALGEFCPDMGFLFAAGAHLFACVVPVASHGSDRVASEVLTPLISGEAIGANAITEAAAGSDIFAMKTRARRDGDDYVLDGEKSFVTNAPYADEFLVYASTDPDAGFLGVSAFLVPRDAKGLVIGAPFQKMGLETAATAPIYLESVRVPKWRCVGVEGAGGRVFQMSMRWERTCLLAAYTGAMNAELDACIAFAKGRAQFGKAIGKNQAISHRIAEMKSRLDAARLLLYRACWLLGSGSDATLEVSVAKLAISEAAIHSSLDAIAIFGGSGYMREVGIERRLRDAVPTAIFSGTSEIQRELIATRLGL